MRDTLEEQYARSLAELQRDFERAREDLLSSFANEVQELKKDTFTWDEYQAFKVNLFAGASGDIGSEPMPHAIFGHAIDANLAEINQAIFSERVHQVSREIVDALQLDGASRFYRLILALRLSLAGVVQSVRYTTRGNYGTSIR